MEEPALYNNGYCVNGHWDPHLHSANRRARLYIDLAGTEPAGQPPKKHGYFVRQSRACTSPDDKTLEGKKRRKSGKVGIFLIEIQYKTIRPIEIDNYYSEANSMPEWVSI